MLCKELNLHEELPGKQRIHANLEMNLSQVKLHRGKVLRMIEYSRGTMSLVRCSTFLPCIVR